MGAGFSHLLVHDHSRTAAKVERWESLVMLARWSCYSCVNLGRVITRPRSVSVLLAMVAVLLPAALVAAVTTERPSVDVRAGDDTMGSAGLSRSALLDERVATRSAEVTVAPPDSTPGPSSSLPTAGQPTSTAAPPATATGPGSTTATLPPGVAPPTGPPPTGIPNITPASAWSGERDGVSARMRIDPPAPVAGQAVRFFLDVSSAEPCCTVMLDFGDGTDGFSVNNPLCVGDSPLTPGPHSAVALHTYVPGAHKATLTVFAGDPCSATPLAPGSTPPLPAIHGVTVTGCVAVGPGTSGAAGCSPFPTFGPDSIISPILDPFCQVRSDCTQASPPR